MSIMLLSMIMWFKNRKKTQVIPTILIPTPKDNSPTRQKRRMWHDFFNASLGFESGEVHFSKS